MKKNLLLYGAKLDSKKLGAALEHIFKTNLALQNTGKRGTPICIWGTHGLGKTEMVRDYAKSRGWHFAYIAPAQFEEMGDLHGMPTISSLSDGNKTIFNPPDWVFAPVWITLYLAMSFAIWLIWINPNRSEKVIYIYFIHLFINGSWSLFFFGLHLILVSLIIIAVIIFLVSWLIKLYYPINKLSSFLMIPYLMWLSYAFVLNFYIFTLN